MVPRKRLRASSTSSVLGLLLLASYVGCFPDLDELSAGDEEAGGGGTGGAAGTESGGTSGSTTGGSSGSDTGGTGNRPAGGTSGAAGSGEAGDTGTGGTGGTSGSGGACSTDTDVGTPDGSSVTDCGACGLTCSLRNATRSICTEGTCEPFCRSGYDNCNPGEDNDGCETSITTPDNCGACGLACSLENVDDADCNSGVCAPACDPGHLDCNPTIANDGCETPETATNCGTCGYTCSVQHAAGASCNAGRCAPTCLPGFGNCNSATQLPTDDGCEVFLDSLTACLAACGGTAVDCQATSVCNLGSCVAPQGVAVLSVPLTAANQSQRYGNIFGANPDLTNGTVTLRLYAPGATGGTLSVFFTDTTGFSAGGFRTIALADLAAGWTDQVFIVGPVAGDFDPVSVRQVNLVVESGTGTGPWTNPTVVYVDSVRASSAVTNIHDAFNTGTPLQGSASVQNLTPSTQQVLSGSTLTWSDTVP